MTITENDFIIEENKLSETDKETLVPVVARELRNHIGKENQIKAKDFVRLLEDYYDIEISEVKLKSLIRYIRHHDIVRCVMSLGGGYWVATSKEECLHTIQMFLDRSKAEKYSMLILTQQVQERYECDIEVDEDGKLYFAETSQS